jgi:CHAD domain-containing protein
VDLQHILQSVELDSGPLKDQKPGIQAGEAEDCLDVKIKINFDRWDQSPSFVIGEKVHHLKIVIQLNRYCMGIPLKVPLPYVALFFGFSTFNL